MKLSTRLKLWAILGLIVYSFGALCALLGLFNNKDVNLYLSIFFVFGMILNWGSMNIIKAMVELLSYIDEKFPEVRKEEVNPYKKGKNALERVILR
jgi:hypothetical protein